jgi:hypothetical protein
MHDERDEPTVGLKLSPLGCATFRFNLCHTGADVVADGSQ